MKPQGNVKHMNVYTVKRNHNHNKKLKWTRHFEQGWKGNRIHPSRLSVRVRSSCSGCALCVPMFIDIGIERLCSSCTYEGIVDVFHLTRIYRFINLFVCLCISQLIHLYTSVHLFGSLYTSHLIRLYMSIHLSGSLYTSLGSHNNNYLYYLWNRINIQSSLAIKRLPWS